MLTCYASKNLAGSPHVLYLSFLAFFFKQKPLWHVCIARKYTNLGDPRPCLLDGVTGPGSREQQAGALQEGLSHEEGIEPGVGMGYSI